MTFVADGYISESTHTVFEPSVDTPHRFYLPFLFCLQVRQAGEMALTAGVVAAVGIGIVALAGALFGGSKKENKSTKWCKGPR